MLQRIYKLRESKKKKRPGEVGAPDATGSGLPIKESGTVVHACHFGG